MIETDLIKKYPFDEMACNNWHLYCVDRCIDLAQHGYTNYVVGVNLNHHSKAVSMNASYFDTLLRLLRKYSDSVQVVSTTCGRWNQQNRIAIYRLIVKERIKQIIRWNKFKYKPK